MSRRIAWLCLSLGLFACSEPESNPSAESPAPDAAVETDSTPPECVAGSAGCACDADACDPGLVCVAGQCEAEPACPEGSAGCPCDAGTCQAGSACVADVCQPESCELGSEGCACGPQQSCGVDADGDAMTCADGLCRSSRCAPGEDGCACISGTDCAGEASACVQGVCMRDDCVAGQDGCLCAGGTCNNGLRCLDGVVCADNTGFLRGACFDDGSCRRGGQCQDDVCVACSLGSAGCHCDDAGGCNAGLACDADGLCVDAQGLANQRPAELRCFTPCTDGVELASGRFVACPADGLMEGCFGDTECVDGQCLADGMSPQLCASDVDCPDFQACLAGKCASNCNTEDDCVAGAVCHRHVCRQTCAVADAPETCGAQAHCQLFDGESGVCRPSVPAADTGIEQKEPFSLSADALDLNNPAGRETVILTNHAPTAVEYTLTRVSHLEFEADGSTSETRFAEDCQAPRCPMWWVETRVDDGQPSSDAVQIVRVEGGDSVAISLDDGQGINAPRWQGVLEISAPEAGVRTVVVSRSATPAGKWSGEAYYFGNFKDLGLESWIANKDDPGAVEAVENAFVRLWANFRQGRLTFDQFQAGLVATRTESWRSPRIYDMGCDPGSVCYPYDNFDGFLTYSTDPINVPVPSGVVEMPMAFNLANAVGDDCNAGECFTGRIESPQALQYAGLPHARLAFDGDPAGCAEGGEACLTFLRDFGAELTVGARYHTTASDVECNGDALLRHARMPWLLEGFLGRSERDDESGRRYTYSCLDVEAPLPGANPVPDGRLRYRNIELVDGALINNSTLFIIFREKLETFLWDQPNDNNGIEGYGYMLLRKSEVEPTPDELEGLAVPRRENADRFLRPIECTDDFLAPLNLSRRDFDNDPAAHADQLAQLVIDGVTTDVDALQLIDPDVEAVHWLCEDTGLFDGGRRDDRVNGFVEQVECPEGSRVTFFTLAIADEDAPLLDDCGGLGLADCHQAFIARQECQRDGSCNAQLQSWIDNDRHGLRMDPYFRCADPNRAFCSDDRLDLTVDKIFFAADESTVVMRPFATEVADAFRYRTRFVNRSGVNLGFVPEICIPGTDLVPYCYDPAAIEALRNRVECGLELYTDHFAAMSENHRLALRAVLIEAFSSAEEVNIFNQITVRRGFEFLDAELMIMLGDEHYTRALASRFDLAQNRVASFEGDLFEEDGIRLSGVAGAEMHNLYAAVQYYQSVLDRFYDLSPLIAGSVKAEREQNQPSFVTPAAVESYFGRLIRASTQKSRAWADIAERYQNFNRPDLARRVIERSYTAGYLESMILTRLMQEIVDITAPEDIAQLQQQIEASQRSYRVALAVMRQHYADITDDVNYFGFAPDFIPFPALEGLRDNSFEVARQRAAERITLAQTAETQALEANLSFNTNAASFQNELARISNTYDAQLSELCGTFDADGQIYPATAKHAYLSDATRAVGDPCGLVGTGQIHNAMAEVDIVLTEVRRVRQSMRNVQEEARIEEARWQEACDVNDAFARYAYQTGATVNTIRRRLDHFNVQLQRADRVVQTATSIAQMSKCSLIVGTANGGDCPAALAGLSTLVAAHSVYEVARAGFDIIIQEKEHEIRGLELGIEHRRNQLACDLTAIDGQARVETILLRTSELELEALKAEYQLSQAISNIQQLRNQATRLQQEQAETEELTINIEAARNNPNVRIYRNDAILNADITFYSALREVYKATRVFEYYTSQSYGPLEQLFLTRMVSRGDFNLQVYMIELEDAFREFEDAFGLPSRRLQVISLKDDILAIPRIGTDGAALTEAQRTAAFREALADPRRLDENGYLTVPFSTSTDSLSPLTRNHKVAHVEAEIIGGGQGDLLARVYLRMAGTSRVAPLGGGAPAFYTFPERLAVINPFFEGSKPLHIDAEIYRNRSLVDRPLVNSRWEFVLNTLDEEVNQDLRLGGLDDVRLYVYYNDFTEF